MPQIPVDWSLKTWLDISIGLKNEKDLTSLAAEEIHNYLQYFVYSTDTKSVGSLDSILGINFTNPLKLK
jgi:hypothetical protein